MDRRAMALSFEEWMVTGYTHFQGTGKHKRGRHLLKSYLVEANAPEVAEESDDGVQKFFDRQETAILVKATVTNDPTIHVLQVGREHEEVEFFLDTLNPRFWILHTVARADVADPRVRALVHRSRLLDAFWLPSRQLETWTGDLGVQRTLTAKFSLAAGMYQEAFSEDDYSDENLLLRIGARSNVRDRWDHLQNIAVLAPQLALWAVRLVRRLDDADIETISDVTAVGKVTSRGQSFRLHEQILEGLVSRYSQMIEAWEKQYRLTWDRVDDAMRPAGATAVLTFPEVIEEQRLQELLTKLFDCSEPFRLYGVPTRPSANRFVVRGVDLHTGDKIDFEITPEFIRCYLFPSTCGNVLARLLTNLQHYVDARIELV